MRRARTLVALACALAGTFVIQTAVATAYSRGFKIYNRSGHPLRLESVGKVPCPSASTRTCIDGEWHIGFEGRAPDGAVLDPGGPPQVFELTYSFGTPHAARLSYKIVGTDGTFEATIETHTFVNDSSCRIRPEHLGHCTAGDLTITFS